MSLPDSVRESLYADFRALGQQITAKNTERYNAARELNRMDAAIEELIAKRQELADHALASGEDFDAVEREQHLMATMGRDYDPMAQW
jgi:ABC-type transporter Mla subunit MlaD